MIFNIDFASERRLNECEVLHYLDLKAYFILKGSTRQDHIIDSDTGQVIGFRNEAFDRAKEEILREYGFITDDGYVEIYARRRIVLAEASENK